jgi:hypothetical protein
MKDQLPAPDFDANRYERPTQKWICGHAADGNPCRVGPDCHGNCRAAFECTPGLDTKQGQPKGRYRCTRPKEFGGPCENGPMPDGSCSRSIPKCSPVRSLRAKRSVFTWAVIAATVAVLLIALAGPKWREFVNPGPVAHQHAGIAFAQMHGGAADLASGCGACHVTARTGFAGWMTSAIHADPGPFDIGKLATTSPPGMSEIDQACLKCHPGRGFHEPNVTRDHSCSACHREHQGSAALHRPEDRNCASCHADPATMEASTQKGRTLAAGLFDFRPSLGRLLFKTPRPDQGYTGVFGNFADHPEFQVVREHLKDPDTLRFNHARHFADDITALNGKKLDCAACHQPDASGKFHLRVSFDLHCRACHSLQFDAANPKLTLPHGDAGAVRAFLRSLPNQYADHATRERGIVGRREVEAFARQQLAGLREQVGTVEELESKVFLSAKRWAPGARVGTLPESARPLFYGCAYCHEVKTTAGGPPAVTPPAMPDRWMVRGEFDHSKHANTACARCHNAEASRDTADILLPMKSACASCHSPEGGVAHGCSTCHSYHTPRKGELSGNIPPLPKPPPL